MEYERIHGCDGFDSLDLACRIGNAHLIAHQPSKAEGYFEQACSMPLSRAVDRMQAETGLIRTYLTEGKASLARHELEQACLAESTGTGDYCAAYLKSLIYAAQFKVDSARQYLKIVEKDPLYAGRAGKLDSIFTWYRAQHLKNPMYALGLSCIIPGAGQWYVGNKKSAIGSFGLMVALSALTGWEGYRFYRGDTRVRYESGMDLFLVISLLWNRYYHSIRKAGYDQAIIHNRIIQLQYQSGLRSILAEP
jgi:hypothetical protein